MTFSQTILAFIKKASSIICFLLLLNVFSSKQVFGQILPPDFSCVTNSILSWAPVNNTCGAFNAFEIYAANNEQGPYNLLASITDPTQTSFFHTDGNLQTWFYYMATNANCVGETTLFSDTLDNIIPMQAIFQNVTVMGSNVEINWIPSPSPEVFGYIISRNTPSGTMILDTVFNGLNTYLDTSADPQNTSEVYFIEAIDQCSNRSLITDPHATTLLQITPPANCQSNIILNWNAYTNWVQGVDHYEVFVSIDGNQEVSLGEVTGNTTSFNYTQANDGENLCFTVEAVENTSLVQSRSSTACIDVAIQQPIREVELLGASVQGNGAVELEWFWDETALVNNANLLIQAGNTEVIQTEMLSFVMPLTAFNLQTISNSNAQSTSYTFSIEATDDCSNMATSNESQSPFLTITDQGGSGNLLSWPVYNHPLASFVSYELINTTAGMETLIFMGTEFDTKYLHELNNNSGGEILENCYHLRVLVEYTLANGDILNRILHSNTVCITPTPQVYVPNVFAPNSVNNTFKAFLSFNTEVGYNMDIYDRWGSHVFNSKDISNGWNGKRNGEMMPQGVYLFLIEILPSGGDAIQLEGDVMLLW